jgi:hypothetical protein
VVKDGQALVAHASQSSIPWSWVGSLVRRTTPSVAHEPG